MSRNRVYSLLVILSFFIFNTSLASYYNSCPCPGECCPLVSYQHGLREEYNPKSFTDIADYLSPWVTTEKDDQMIENIISKYKTS